MTEWPNNAPRDLRHMLDQIARYRDAPASSDIWAVVKEWLELHNVQPTDTALQQGKKSDEGL